MGHKSEYLVRLSEDRIPEEWWIWNVNIKSGIYKGSGNYRMIHANSFEEAIAKWNDYVCPNELKRLWAESDINESLVMVIDYKGNIKYYI